MEIVENRKLVFTSALLPGFRPLPPEESASGLQFSAVILLEPHKKGTKYTAIAIHPDEKSSSRHKEMGFFEGWSKALEQLVEVAKKM